MKRSNLKPFLAALLILLFGLGLWNSWRESGTLLKRSMAIYGPDPALKSDQTYSGYFSAKYHYACTHSWVSEDQLLIHYNREHNELKFRALRLNLPTRTETPLPDFEKLVDGKNEARPFLWLVSPDGRWLLSVREQQTNAVFTVTDLNWTVAQLWTNRWMNTRPIWLSRSQGFVEQIFDEGESFARLYRLDSPQSERIRLNVEPMAAPPEFGRAPMAVLPEASQPDAVECVSFEFAEWKTTMGKFAFPVPSELRASDWTLYPSPAGDRLAWLAYYRQKLPHLAVQREFPFVQAEPRYVGCLWLSRTDGTELRALGRLQPGDEIRRVAWAPDGKRLSFILRERIWVLPVE